MSDCLFCKLLNGEVPSYTIYENEYAQAFLEIQPSADGHTIIIPKTHYDRFEELPQELVQAVFLSVQKAYGILQNTLGVQDANIGWNNGPAAGREIPHLHIHIIPRTPQDNGRPMQHLAQTASQSVEDVHQQIQQQLHNSSE